MPDKSPLIDEMKETRLRASQTYIDRENAQAARDAEARRVSAMPPGSLVTPGYKSGVNPIAATFGPQPSKLVPLRSAYGELLSDVIDVPQPEAAHEAMIAKQRRELPRVGGATGGTAIQRMGPPAQPQGGAGAGSIRRRGVLPQHLQGEYGRAAEQGRYYNPKKAEPFMSRARESFAAWDKESEKVKEARKEPLRIKVIDGEMSPDDFNTAIDAIDAEVDTATNKKKKPIQDLIARYQTDKKKSDDLYDTAVMRGQTNILAQGLRAQGAQEAISVIEEAKVAEVADSMEDTQNREAKAQALRVKAHANAMAGLREKKDAADARVRDYRIEDKRPVGQRVAHGLLIAMGEFAAIMTGRGNTALKIIEGQIDDHIEAQKIEFDSMREQGKESRNDLAAYQTEYKSNEESYLALKLAYLDQYKTQMAQVRAHTKGARALANIDDFDKQIDMAYKQTEFMLLGQAAKNEMGAIAAQDAARAAAMAAKAKAQSSNPPMNQVMSQVIIPSSMANSYMKEFGGYLNTPGESRTRVAGILAQANTTIQLNRERQNQIRKGGSTWIPYSEGRAKVESMADSLSEFKSVAHKMGVLTAADEDRITKAIGDARAPTEMNTLTLAKLEALEQLHVMMKQDLVKYYGIRPGIPLPAGKNEKGELQDRALLVNPPQGEATENLRKAFEVSGQEIPPGLDQWVAEQFGGNPTTGGPGE